SSRTVKLPDGIPRSARDRGNHLLPNEQNPSRVVLGGMERGTALTTQPGPSRNANRQARGNRIHLSVTQLIYHDPPPVLDWIDPSEADYGTTVLAVAQIESRIGDAPVAEDPGRCAAPRRVNEASMRAPVARVNG